MAERRSNRSKKVVDYAKFVATEDNDDDFEEFKAQPTKRAKVDIKEKDNVQANTLKNGKPTSENRTESLPRKAQSVKQNRLPLEEKVLQRQIKQALKVSKSDIVDDEANDSEKDENSCSSSSSDEQDSDEDEFRPSKKQVKKAPAKQKKITNTVENDKTSKIKETLNGTESSEEKPNASKLVVKADDVKDDHTESDNDDSQSSDQSSSQSSEESTSEPSEESSNHSSDESNSNNEEFQPIKKQNKKVNAANKKAKSATKAQHAIPKKEIKVAATLVVNGAEVLKAIKPIVQKADELKKDITTTVPTTGKGSITSTLHSPISNSAAKRKGPIRSPAIPSRNSVQMPLKGIRIGLSRKISRKPLHPSVKPQS